MNNYSVKVPQSYKKSYEFAKFCELSPWPMPFGIKGTIQFHQPSMPNCTKQEFLPRSYTVPIHMQWAQNALIIQKLTHESLKVMH